MDQFRNKSGYICDMDGVIYHGNRLLPGAKEFVEWLYREQKKFLFLTNNSGKTPRELQDKLARMGLEVDEQHFYTSALATAEFIAAQMPGARPMSSGSPGCTTPCTTGASPSATSIRTMWSWGSPPTTTTTPICKAVHLVQKGARFIGCNSDLTGPTEEGLVPSCRALVAPIEMATGQQAYFIGKPNPLMMRTGLKLLGVHSQDAAIIGDRMDTDIVAGIESGLDTLLVLSGVTTREEMERFPYRPRLILNGVGEIPPAQA